MRASAPEWRRFVGSNVVGVQSAVGQEDGRGEERPFGAESAKSKARCVPAREERGTSHQQSGRAAGAVDATVTATLNSSSNNALMFEPCASR